MRPPSKLRMAAGVCASVGLLLGAKSVGPQGAFSGVTSIQRVATTGGTAPAGECSQAGARARVDYTADYYFFTAR